jgi:NMD protein affecting ribosome stability and mRNA decay
MFHVEEVLRVQRGRPSTGPRSENPRAPRREERPGKLPELAGCPRCGASYRDGRWTWSAAPADAYERTCPACERIEANYPASVIDVDGAFVGPHRDDLIGLIRNIETRERDAHPLKRILNIESTESGFRVTTTDAKLADSFGRALTHAYAGRLERPRTASDRENLVRLHWSRD